MAAVPDVAERVAQRLRERDARIVFAESCTAGWVSALLSAVPGISTHLCGSLVTYREASKQAWLFVDGQTLAEHTAVSSLVTRQMAAGALQRTAEAQIAAAITGHVGPHAPPPLDGVCFVALAMRHESGAMEWVCEDRWQLQTTERVDRQHEAAHRMLAWIAENL